VAIFRLDNQVAAAVSAVTSRVVVPAAARPRATSAAGPAPRAQPAPRPQRSATPDDGNWQAF
jgi:methyl-accepting chemotaxis protein